jgi:MFS family permease
MGASEIHRSTLPGRLDALPWSRWHWRVVIALGVTWILDGLEVTIVGSVGPALQQHTTLALTATELGWAGSAYVAGAVAGALLFGRLADRFGRKRLFIVTLCVYLVATLLTSVSWNFTAFAFCRFLTGFGIGGEYAAINSAIDEMIPARVRGLVDLAINGSFWIGAAAGAALSIVLLDPTLFAPNVGWRLAFVLGAALAIAIVLVRRYVPESPRWLLTHGRVAEAEAAVEAIEAEVSRRHVLGWSRVEPFAIRVRELVSWREIARLIVTHYRRRAVLGFVLMASQAFFYNAIFFTYALILTVFYGVPVGSVGWYLLPFAAGNFLGPLLLGRLFDTLGRKTMIGATYAISGLLLAVTGYLFARDIVSVQMLTVAWMIIFFFASAAASSAYLTVSEIFPLEIRALAIAFFYAVGTGMGGVVAPWLLGTLIDTGSRGSVAAGYYLGAALMIAAASVEWRWGIAAERRPLEQVCRPLTFID